MELTLLLAGVLILNIGVGWVCSFIPNTFFRLLLAAVFGGWLIGPIAAEVFRSHRLGKQA